MRQKYLFLSAESKNNLCPRLSKDEIDYENVSPIKKVETVESLKATLKHHHNIGTFVQSSQEFTFIGKPFQVIYSNFDTIYFNYDFNQRLDFSHIFEILLYFTTNKINLHRSLLHLLQ